MIRRYASHLLYGSAGQLFRQYVVELHDGILHDFYPLTRELPSVIWLGGVVVLSPLEKPVLEADMGFDDLIASLTSYPGLPRLYAYAFKGLNVSDRTWSAGAFLEKLG